MSRLLLNVIVFIGFLTLAALALTPKNVDVDVTVTTTQTSIAREETINHHHHGEPTSPAGIEALRNDAD